LGHGRYIETLLEKIMDAMIIHEIIRWIICKVSKWKISPENASSKQKILPYCQKALATVTGTKSSQRNDFQSYPDAYPAPTDMQFFNLPPIYIHTLQAF
jgi:hypothetical protein